MRAYALRRMGACLRSQRDEHAPQLTMEQRSRSEIHFIAHILRKSFHTECELLVSYRIDRDKGGPPAIPVGPDHNVRTIRPFLESSGFRPNRVSYFGRGFYWLHSLTHAVRLPLADSRARARSSICTRPMTKRRNRQGHKGANDWLAGTRRVRMRWPNPRGSRRRAWFRRRLRQFLMLPETGRTCRQRRRLKQSRYHVVRAING